MKAKEKIRISLIINLLMVLVTSLILLIPLVDYAIAYNQNPANYQLLLQGYNKTLNLTCAICISVLVVIMICLNGYWMMQQMQKVSRHDNIVANTKNITMMVATNVVMVVIFLVLFFAIWLYVMPNSDISEIPNLNKSRLNAYIIAYVIATGVGVVIQGIASWSFGRKIKWENKE